DRFREKAEGLVAVAGPVAVDEHAGVLSTRVGKPGLIAELCVRADGVLEVALRVLPAAHRRGEQRQTAGHGARRSVRPTDYHALPLVTRKHVVKLGRSRGVSEE